MKALKSLPLLLTLLIPVLSIAEDFEYPELMVTPRASQRLYMEASKERRSPFVLIQYQLSAATTLTAGLLQSGNLKPGSDLAGRSKFAGIVVGGGWLAVTSALGMMDHPYSSGWGTI